ncbi:hypothetical protein RVV87_004861 [Citrobacter freundii]|nr:hypothetical protein [Citrobacter freundii]
MNRFILIILLLIPSISFASDSFTDAVKNRFQKKTAVDLTDWYAKGNTWIAEFKGETYLLDLDLKAAVRKNEINIKMRHLKGTEKPDVNFFVKMTSGLCAQIFEPFIFPEQASKGPRTWDDESPRPLEFLYLDSLTQAQDDPIDKTVNGWNIKAERSVLLTSCSAIKQ